MHEDAEPIEAMGRFIHGIAKPDEDWNNLPEGRKFYWYRIAAHAFETYWNAREARERLHDTIHAANMR